MTPLWKCQMVKRLNIIVCTSTWHTHTHIGGLPNSCRLQYCLKSTQVFQMHPKRPVYHFINCEIVCNVLEKQHFQDWAQTNQGCRNGPRYHVDLSGWRVWSHATIIVLNQQEEPWTHVAAWMIFSMIRLQMLHSDVCLVLSGKRL